MSGNHSSACVRARLRDSDGRIQIARTTRKRATQLERRARERAAPRVLVDAATGVITGVLDDSPPPLEQILDRFRLVVDPAPFDPFVPEQWLDLIERWTDPAQRTRRLPCLVIEPRCTVVSDSRWRGVRPAQEQSRSGEEKREMSPISVTRIAANTGPIPGSSWSTAKRGSLRSRRWISRSSIATSRSRIAIRSRSDSTRIANPRPSAT